MEKNYDFIVIGGGSSGCVVAARLSENPAFSVLLIEAGKKDTNLNVKIPAAFYKTFKTNLDWDYSTTPQKGLNNRELYVPRGKVLGGSGSINAMIYIRGHQEDFNEWAAEGNHGWDYANVLPYFVKSEKNMQLQGEGIGSDGPLHVTDLLSPNPLTETFIQAAEETGLKRIRNFNLNPNEGAGAFQATQKNGQRHSPSKAFLGPAKKRGNLTILTNATVKKLNVHQAKAIEVEVIVSGKEKTFQAKKEIILSAGAINSPQLLMLSGIGDKTQLSEAGIQCVYDLPAVGKGLQDHPVVPLIYHCTQNITLDKAENIGNVLRYFLFKKGPLTSILAEGGGYWKSDKKLTAPDIQLHFGPVFFVDHGFTRPDGNGISLGAILAKPLSRGAVKINPADPSGKPLINPNVYSVESDLEKVRTGLDLCRRIFKAKAFDPFRGAIFSPEKENLTAAEEIEYIRNSTEILYHPSSSCRMGNDGVVDNRLKVHGIKNLRIIDASIMPSITRGNTNAPAIMIGEKGADLIKEDMENE